MSWQDFQDYRRESKAFSRLGLTLYAPMNVSDEGRPAEQFTGTSAIASKRNRRRLLREQMRLVEPDLPLFEIQTLDALLGYAGDGRRVRGRLFLAGIEGDEARSGDRAPLNTGKDAGAGRACLLARDKSLESDRDACYAQFPRVLTESHNARTGAVVQDSSHHIRRRLRDHCCYLSDHAHGSLSPNGA